MVTFYQMTGMTCEKQKETDLESFLVYTIGSFLGVFYYVALSYAGKHEKGLPHS